MSSYCFYSQSSQPKSSSCAMCEMKLPEDIAKKSPHCMGSEVSSLFSCILSLVPVLYYFLQMQPSKDFHSAYGFIMPPKAFWQWKGALRTILFGPLFSALSNRIRQTLCEIKVVLSLMAFSSSRPCDSCNPVAKRLPRKMKQRWKKCNSPPTTTKC